MIDALSKFRKKYTLAMMMFFAGTGFAFYVQASMTEYSFFCGTLLAIFGTADLIDKDKFNGSAT